jgi:hypothetical protein
VTISEDDLARIEKRLNTDQTSDPYALTQARRDCLALFAEVRAQRNTLTWIEHFAVGHISLACADEPHYAVNGIALVARAMSETTAETALELSRHEARAHRIIDNSKPEARDV